MKYEERLRKLNGLSEFINGEKQDDILLVLDKKYSDDKWNIICSAVHWFRTVESYLNSENLLKENKEDYNWGEVYLFLSSVDIVIEGINDINKIAKDNEKARLFYKSSEIFKDKEKDDWEHFKNIRAIFGAHPTKLKDNNEFIVSTYPTPYNSSATFPEPIHHATRYKLLPTHSVQTYMLCMKNHGHNAKKSHGLPSLVLYRRKEHS